MYKKQYNIAKINIIILFSMQMLHLHIVLFIKCTSINQNVSINRKLSSCLIDCLETDYSNRRWEFRTWNI